MLRLCPCCKCCCGRCAKEEEVRSQIVRAPDARTAPMPWDTPSPAASAGRPAVPPAQVYVSLWDFQARAEEELSFQAGDLFQVLDESGDWWKVKKVAAASGRSCTEQGFVPQNYLAKQEAVDVQPWFFGELTRTEASNMLMSPENKRGTFLVRESEKQGFEYVLSVRDQDFVRHFKILMSAQRNFHVNSMSSFPDLDTLIEHYKGCSLVSGLKLTKPCTKQEPALNDLSHDLADVWERPKHEFECGVKLGSGNFGDVYEALWKNSRIPVKVAIKIIKTNLMNIDDFHKETQIMKKLQHRHLLTLYAICSQNDPYYIITELMPKGDLLTLLRGDEGHRLSPNDLLDMAYQVVDGMEFLESKGYIHRDLAARNILVGKENICKVADFGMARIIKDEFYLSCAKNVPYRWTAPEALSHGRFSIKSDVWSFGILMFEIMTRGQIPYTVIPTAEVLDTILNGYRLPKPRDCPEKVYHLMSKCWELKSNRRPSFSELKVQVENLASYEETDYYCQ